VTARTASEFYERLTDRVLALRRATATANGDAARRYRAELKDMLRARDELLVRVEGDR
jgi:hypothetical protein